MSSLTLFHAIRSAILALFFMVALPALAEEQMRFDKEPLLIQTAAGKVLHFTVEIASTPDQRARGLMFRKVMADDAGMIFDFDEPRRVTMWMENTILPLDMLFADDTGTIRHIKEKAVPYSRDIIDSMSAVKYVVELNAGIVAKLGIKPGDRIVSATTTKKAK
ncbi:DUF192 domain-containing protein [Rhizobium leguminosarum]|jgi:uncharacterized membrane protein (UPF0127 family)|uniref:DUF192 domain-containing protein n=1 Tax=Rhizobium TaxID=379 RepID=UPI0003613267|nr:MULTISPECIES: DUF192 domain-containing protein [Rhizobium]MBA8831446.1 hypothetical protein [Rhizobium leguminosarum]MCJ9691624.1 DUF192 domain-containing protein [Rhizobium sp. PRIMUS64]MVO95023.1 DUF192 domain-containing protein [Rhizobium leguminosarum bv. phaseoli]NKK03138.1 DUF192 domain-containing protein [Rhizobium leguminosarum bv. viciae]NKK88732.1 DUF192 domain-containing protein [Rhizobium leguminosarum bv. viciae]